MLQQRVMESSVLYTHSSQNSHPLFTHSFLLDSMFLVSVSNAFTRSYLHVGDVRHGSVLIVTLLSFAINYIPSCLTLDIQRALNIDVFPTP